MSKKNYLYCISDIHGDFELLVELLTNVTKVATYSINSWTWIAIDTVLIVLGDFTDRFRNKANNKNLSTHQAIQDEIKIIDAFTQLIEQTNDEKINSKFIVLAGNHELGNILMISNYLPYQIANVNSVVERRMRINFVKKYLIPFCSTIGVIAKWCNYFFAHGGFEMDWLHRNKFLSIANINQRWQLYLRKKDIRNLNVFAENDSVLMSRKMPVKTREWRDYDKFRVSALLGYELLPKFVVGHTSVFYIKDNFTNWRIPYCKNAKETFVLSSRDPSTGEDDIFYIDISMGDGFTPSQSTYTQRFDRRPQALKLIVNLDSKNNVMFSDCETVAMSEIDFIAYDKEKRATEEPVQLSKKSSEKKNK